MVDQVSRRGGWVCRSDGSLRYDWSWEPWMDDAYERLTGKRLPERGIQAPPPPAPPPSSSPDGTAATTSAAQPRPPGASVACVDCSELVDSVIQDAEIVDRDGHEALRLYLNSGTWDISAVDGKLDLE